MSARGAAGAWRVVAPLAVLLVIAVGLGLISGSSATRARAIVEAIGGGGDPVLRQILWDIRLPRVLLAALVGAALAAAGAVFQAVLRNPLADPFILGVSGGAALGTTLAIALAGGSVVATTFVRPTASFAGGVGTLVLLFALARFRGRTETMTLLLTGVVLNAFTSAVILFLATAGDPARFQQVMQTLLGQMREPAWSAVGASALVIGVAVATLVALAHPLNLLALGEEEAGYLGLDVERSTWVTVLASSLATAAAVAFAGIVGFVGLIVPHAVRALVGPDHRVLLPASVLAGAAFLVLADAAARTVIAPVELPVGVITALLGGPFFLLLLAKRLRTL